MTGTDILMMAALPVLLCCSAFFSGGETALFSLSRHQRLELSRSASIPASIVTRLLNERRDLLVTVLMGNLFVNVIYFVIGTVLLIRMRERETVGAAMVGVLNLAALFVLILTGEVVPKLVAAQHPMVWSNWAALPLMVVHRVLTPIRGVVRGAIIVPLSRLLAPRQRPVELSPAELERLLELSQHQGVIDDKEEQLLQQVLSLSQLKVRDLMRPRIDMIAFELTQNPQKLIAMVAETRFSRLPVYRRDIDHIVGVVHRRQVLLTKPRTTDQVQALVRPARFVPDLQRADRLLVELRKARSTMVVVVDEYGGTAGLVTLEDVVEKMVGKIANRHESEPAPQVQSVGADQWRVSARLGILDWVSAFGTVVPIAGVSTIGGLIMARLGRLPNVGDRTNVGNLSIEVEKMDGRRMVTLLLQLTDGHSDDQAQAEK